jgi:hypothetical protein
MRTLAAVTYAMQLIQLPSQIFLLFTQALRQSVALYDLYGPTATLLLLFGSRTTWVTEVQVLGRFENEEARQFRQSVQDECTMVSVAVRVFQRRLRYSL